MNGWFTLAKHVENIRWLQKQTEIIKQNRKTAYFVATCLSKPSQHLVGRSPATTDTRMLKTLARTHDRLYKNRDSGPRGCTNLLPEVCQQLQYHMHTVPVAAHFTGSMRKTVSVALLHCLRHYASTSAHWCALIGWSESACPGDGSEAARAQTRAQTRAQPEIERRSSQK